MNIEKMLAYMWTFVGCTPYKMGGNVIQDGGLDCSAFVLEGLRSVGKWGRSDARAQDIYNAGAKLGTVLGLKEITIEPGDILFFGESDKKISHVAVALNSTQMIEAGGTDKDGMVRVRPLAWRSDYVGVVRLKLH